jgi:hypothetical protein
LRGCFAHLGATGTRRGVRGAPPARPSRLVVGTSTSTSAVGFPCTSSRAGGAVWGSQICRVLSNVMQHATTATATATATTTAIKDPKMTKAPRCPRLSSGPNSPMQPITSAALCCYISLRRDFHFFYMPHINNRPLKTILSHAKLKMARQVGRWRKPVLISRWPVVRFAESWLLLLHVTTTASFA